MPGVSGIAGAAEDGGEVRSIEKQMAVSVCRQRRFVAECEGRNADRLAVSLTDSCECETGYFSRPGCRLELDANAPILSIQKGDYRLIASERPFGLGHILINPNRDLEAPIRASAK